MLAGSVLELPLGLVAGHGRRRSRLVIVGGVVFVAALAAVSVVRSFWALLLAFVVFFPASGAFVSLTQAALMDAAPARHQQRMAAWNLAGSVGAVSGPVVFAALFASGGGWRGAYLMLAAAGAVALAVAGTAGPARHLARAQGGERAADLSEVAQGAAGQGAAGQSEAGQGAAGQGAAGQSPTSERALSERQATAADDEDSRPSVRDALAALRRGTTARWLVLLEVSDLLLDVLTGYVGVYMVDVAHVSPARAALAVAVRLGAGLAGDALFVPLSRRVSGPSVLRATALAATLLYPAFLLVPWLPAKLAVLAVLSAGTACWYPVIQAGLYTSLPGRSGIAVSLSSAASLLGAAGPLAVGVVAQQAGLVWALAGLAAAPLAVLAGAPRRSVPAAAPRRLQRGEQR